MNSIHRRSRRLESVVSICILGGLFFIASAVLVKQSRFDMAHFGIVAPTGQDSVGPKDVDLKAFLPAGYKILSQLEIYQTDNLYEKINGKAPLYTDAGFEKLLTQRFVNENDPDLITELYLYDMGQAKNAFSVYSLQKRPDAQPIPKMPLTYKTPNGLYLMHGKYYVELVGFVTADELSNAMTEIGRKIRSDLPVAGTEIAELKLLSGENLVHGTIKLYTESAFGLASFDNVFAANYKIADQTLTGFVSKRSDPQNAQQMAKTYYQFLLDNGAKAVQPKDSDSNVMMADFYGTVEIIFTQGVFVAGVHEAEDQTAAEKLAQILIDKLSEVAEND